MGTNTQVQGSYQTGVSAPTQKSSNTSLSQSLPISFTDAAGNPALLIQNDPAAGGKPAINMPQGTETYPMGGLLIDTNLTGLTGYFAAIELIDGYGQKMAIGTSGGSVPANAWLIQAPGGITCRATNALGNVVVATNPTLVCRLGAGQTGDLLELQNSTPTTLVKVDSNGVIYPLQAPTASAPPYVKGGMYFDTTLNKLRIGGATAWETVTSS